MRPFSYIWDYMKVNNDGGDGHKPSNEYILLAAIGVILASIAVLYFMWVCLNGGPCVTFP